MKKYDAVVVGSGPNGLAAAVTMAKAGFSVVVLEASKSIGGGTRSEEATLPGFIHDICSAVHPLAIASPFFRSLQLEKFGLEWIHSPIELAHPLDDGKAAFLHRSVEETAEHLGSDQKKYLKIFKPLAENWEDVFAEILQPILHWSHRPFLLARFGLQALMPATTFAHFNFKTSQAQALFAGIAAHVNAPLNSAATASIGLMLNLAAHAKGWPIPKGGSQKIADALSQYLLSLGGEIQTNLEIRTWKQLPESRWTFFDLSPRQISGILSDRLPQGLHKKFSQYRYGPGVYKMDWALSQPIPWSNQGVSKAATVHLGGSMKELVESEAAPFQGRHSERPYVLLSQPSLFDSSRAPQSQHTAWAYCHVPHGSQVDMSEKIENQIERFAPGFRETILAKRTLNTKEIEIKNANMIGGDIGGGAISLLQLLFRPGFNLNPYRLPIPGHYICSASTPPGPAVHGMCGFNAALSALKEN